MSISAVGNVLTRSKSKGTARLVLIALADVASEDGEVLAYARSQRVLAAKANCSVDAVRRAVLKLVEIGEVEIVQKSGGWRSTDYRILICGEVPPPISGELESEVPPPISGSDPTNFGEFPHQFRGVTPPISGGIIPSLSVDTPSPSVSRDSAFARFWSAYPRTVAKGNARKAWGKIPPELFDEIVSAAERFASEVAGSDPKFVPHPATWLNGERWTDAPGENVRGVRAPVGARGQVDPDAVPSGRLAI